MSLCVITPRLPPAIDGVGDYCRQFWLHLPASAPGPVALGTRWQFLVLDGAQASRAIWPEIDIYKLNTSADGLASQLDDLNPSAVILQYVGYGYANNGAPHWLSDGLALWKHGRSHPLIVMFHETWPRALPWQRTFWQIAGQRQCIRKLMENTNAAITSVAANERALKTLSPALQIEVIPIGSCFPETTTDAQKNWKSLLIFGKEATRLRAVKIHESLIKEMDRLGLIDKIILSGQKTAETDPAMDSLRKLNLRADIESAYNFDGNAVPPLVESCGLSLMFTQTTYLMKSTVFQLSASSGQVPITIRELDADRPLTDGQHFLSYEKGRLDGIICSLRDTHLLKCISDNCRSLSRSYLSWPHIASAWCNVLERCIKV